MGSLRDLQKNFSSWKALPLSKPSKSGYGTKPFGYPNPSRQQDPKYRKHNQKTTNFKITLQGLASRIKLHCAIIRLHSSVGLQPNKIQLNLYYYLNKEIDK
ncbi:MAG: hypothetical protein KGI54_13495 [Pseudomonadota bacterium]|nr:hypothetical protein [Pseudomonadota bacterium]